MSYARIKLDHRVFVRLADDAFGDVMRTWGFEPAGARHEADWHCSRMHQAGERYIEVSADSHFRDGEPWCNVVLGEGSTDWPERDWNNVVLWRLMIDQREWRLESWEAIAGILERMRDSLERWAEDFLRGDLERFRTVRGEVNRAREPYQILERRKRGRGYESRDDPESRRLKDRFS
jgi:hypothetical protein